jgi:hypothetical protein
LTFLVNLSTKRFEDSECAGLRFLGGDLETEREREEEELEIERERESERERDEERERDFECGAFGENCFVSSFTMSIFVVAFEPAVVDPFSGE